MEAAIALYETIPLHEEAAKRVKAYHYQLAEAALAQGNTDEAAAQFTLAGDYEDAAERILSIRYGEAEAAFDGRRLRDGHIDLYAEISDYQDSAARMQAAQYLIAAGRFGYR